MWITGQEPRNIEFDIIGLVQGYCVVLPEYFVIKVVYSCLLFVDVLNRLEDVGEESWQSSAVLSPCQILQNRQGEEGRVCHVYPTQHILVPCSLEKYLQPASICLACLY